MNAFARCVRLVALVAFALGLGARTVGAQTLYWLDTNYAAPTLNKSDPNGFGVISTPLAAGSLPEGLAIESGGKLYWAESAWSGANIERAGWGLSGATPVVTGGSAFRGMAVDDVSHLLYWTASNLATGPAIWRSALDGSGAAAIVALNPGANPRGIAVDHVGGRIYWTDFDLSAIWRANLDGSAPMLWLPLGFGTGPYGIVFDPATQTIYWTEYGTGNIQRSSTLGPTPVLIQPGRPNPTYITYDPNGAELYWIEAAGPFQRLIREASFGGPIVPLPPPVASYGGIAFLPATAGATPLDLPRDFSFDRSWPVPSRDAIHLAFSLPRDADVRLTVHDLAGRAVAVLADGRLPAGRHDLTWNARGQAPAGIYFARLAAGGRTWARRLVLLP